MQDKRILLIVGGGIAAYKSLDLVRRLKERGASVRAILTKGGAEFVTPLSLSVLTEEKAFTDLFDLKDEAEIGHIRLSREADLIVVAPATADLLAKMAHGLADDLATAVLLATDKGVLAAPAMNVRMWEHPATQRNLATLRADGIRFVGPDEGEMACGEFGLGRMAEPATILEAIAGLLGAEAASPRAATTPLRTLTGSPLRGRRVLITSGPTQEPIDPVRYIANRSSGKQGHALARAAAALGAEVTLVSGPVTLPDPDGVRVVKVDTAHEMLAAVAGRASRRHRHLRRCRRRLARGRRGSAQAEKAASGDRDHARAHFEPRHPRDRRQARSATSRASSSALPPRPRI